MKPITSMILIFLAIIFPCDVTSAGTLRINDFDVMMVADLGVGPPATALNLSDLLLTKIEYESTGPMTATLKFGVGLIGSAVIDGADLDVFAIDEFSVDFEDFGSIAEQVGKNGRYFLGNYDPGGNHDIFFAVDLTSLTIEFLDPGIIHLVTIPPASEGTLRLIAGTGSNDANFVPTGVEFVNDETITLQNTAVPAPSAVAAGMLCLFGLMIVRVRRPHPS